MRTRLLALCGTVLVFCSVANADVLKFSGDTTGLAVAVQASRGQSASFVVPVKGKTAAIPNKGTGTVSILKESKYWGPLVMAIKYKNSYYTLPKARKAKICTKATARAVMGLKAAKRTDKVTLSAADGIGYLSSLPSGKSFDTALAKVDVNCVPKGAKHRLGIPSALAKARVRALSISGADTCSTKTNDKDADGVTDTFDADNNNDSVLDNDDAACNDMSGGEGNVSGFWMFSNFHLEFVDSLNASMPGMTLTKELIDERLQTYNGLAIQVVGKGESNVELNCGSLSYCSAGGTGTVSDGPPGPGGQPAIPFPGAPGGTYDPDGNGKGLLRAGNTGDFQLKTNASSEAIKAGDVLIEEVAESGGVKSYTGMLNFAFWTTPALKELSVQGGQSYTISYPVKEGDPGTRDHCFRVPATGDVVVTVTMWRPQRQGNVSAGEAELMDMGNLRLQTNIPNGPVTVGPLDPGQPQGPMQGPGTCKASELTYPSVDSNFTRVMDAIQDHLGDTASSPANTFTYTINYSECLKAVNNFNNADIVWGPNQSLHVPLQMTNQYGDTAVQNVCFVKDAA